jgi:hypothetical protein
MDQPVSSDPANAKKTGIAHHLGEKVGGVDRLELAVDIDLLQLIDQNDRRIAVIRDITRDHAQGAAIGGGGLWIARSDWSWGTLDRLDPSTGAPQRRYEIAPGTEGIAFGSAGQLWAVSEAGSRHIYDHPFLGLFEPFFPLVFALDLSRLE